MIKRIKGKTYNTDTADKLACITVGKFGEETGYEEVLYKTSKGEYFMYTNGGPASKYPVETIALVDEKAAKAFIKESK